jgi:hypothetical protein
MRPRIIRCYAEGRPGKWEAFCLDFDLAVQGSSFQDVYDKLDEQVALYLDGVKDLPAADRSRLLNRRAPAWIWVQLFARAFWAGLFPQGGEIERHSYSRPLEAITAAA